MKHIEKIEKESEDLFVVGNMRFKGLANDKLTPDGLKSFLRQAHTSFIQDLIQRVEGERKVYAPDTTERLFIDPVAVDGFNTALDTIIKMLKEELAYIGGVNLTTNDNEISSRLAVTDRNIGMLRQWLNEKDPEKMITNDDIKFWLDIK